MKQFVLSNLRWIFI